MNRRHVMAAMISTTAAMLAMGAALAQPTLSPQGGGNVDMDHSRMGGPSQQGRAPSGPAPTLSPQGSGSIEMQHGRMGGQNMGGGTPTIDPKGDGTSGAEITHPGNPGTGHGHEGGGTQRR